MRAKKAKSRTTLLGWFAVGMIVTAMALGATFAIVTTENKPALPGVVVSEPAATQYCLAPTSRYGFCFGF